MASCRSAATAAMAGMRSMASRSNSVARILSPKPIPTSPFASSTRPVTRTASRVVAALGSVESMMPLHSAIASARLRSSIAVDSTCWSLLSQVPELNRASRCCRSGKVQPTNGVILFMSLAVPDSRFIKIEKGFAKEGNPPASEMPL